MVDTDGKIIEDNIGRVVGVKDFAVEVEFLTHNYPKIYDVLYLEKNNTVKMVVFKSSGQNTFYCISLSPVYEIERGSRVVNTHEPIRVPVGNSVIGRVIDLYGNPKDGLHELSYDEVRSIYNKPPEYDDISSKQILLETGIKVVDLFAPLIKGGKTGLFGGSGVGKTILLTEILHNIVNKDREKNVSIFCGIGERTREGHELYKELQKTGVLDCVSLVLSSMGDSPSIRFLTTLSAVSQAEHFRDANKKDVLFFIDNIFRFAQAGNELSLLMNTIPSEDGYQPTLGSEMAAVHERLVSSKNNTLTTIEAIYMPSDDLLDPGVQSVYSYLDSGVVLSREVYREGRYPSVDILNSTSSALNINTVSPTHYYVTTKAQNLLNKALSLERIVSLVGESELSDEDKQLYIRAKKIKNYMTQNFFVSSSQTGKEGVYIPLQTTIQDVKDIIDGMYDVVSEDKFLYIGSAKELHEQQ
jgi:F-type H+/Na+-transporting ATPase subunit beta